MADAPGTPGHEASPPPIRLLVVGAGPVGQAVAELAARVDFAVTVVDDDPGPALRGPEITPGTYALVVTRGTDADRDALGVLAPSPAGYVGMIGNRRKVREITDALRAAGVPEAALARVAMPVGLPIGSRSDAEIAVSIVAELIARRNLGPEALDRLRAAGGRQAQGD